MVDSVSESKIRRLGDYCFRHDQRPSNLAEILFQSASLFLGCLELFFGFLDIVLDVSGIIRRLSRSNRYENRPRDSDQETEYTENSNCPLDSLHTDSISLFKNSRLTRNLKRRILVRLAQLPDFLSEEPFVGSIP
jgi:hypothetical protein